MDFGGTLPALNKYTANDKLHFSAVSPWHHSEQLTTELFKEQSTTHQAEAACSRLLRQNKDLKEQMQEQEETVKRSTSTLNKKIAQLEEESE